MFLLSIIGIYSGVFVKNTENLRTSASEKIFLDHVYLYTFTSKDYFFLEFLGFEYFFVIFL